MAQIAEIAGAGAGWLTLPERIVLAEGWTRRAVAFCAGACGALALAPFNFILAMFAPLTVAVWLIDGADDAGSVSRFNVRPLRSAAEAGWWLGFGYFLAGLWWLGAAMLVEADQFAWAIPLAVFGLPAVLAFFPALGFAIARLLWSPGGWRVFALAAGLGAAEWLRGHILSGFPWNNFGMALAGAGPLAQTASLVGLYGLDMLAVVIFAAPATIDHAAFGRQRPNADNVIDSESLERALREKPVSTFSQRALVVDRPGLMTGAMRIAAALLLAMLAFGALRLATSDTRYVEGVKLRLMQPNLPQDAKFRPENGPKILRHYLALSGASGVSSITHHIWPESAFPYVISHRPEALHFIADTLKNGALVTGAARAEGYGEGRRGRIFNSIEALKGGDIVAFYDKIHLVPFGEYLPLESLLQPLGVNHLVPGVWDRGTGPRRLDAPGLPPIAPLICYEAIFPGEAVTAQAGAKRPELLLNLTNDGWFGQTTGPYQHFAQARLRTIEEGLPMVRVANTGVSAIIDAYGRVLQSLPLGEEGVIDGPLPRAAAATIFSKYGAFIFPALLALATALALKGRFRKS